MYFLSSELIPVLFNVVLEPQGVARRGGHGAADVHLMARTLGTWSVEGVAGRMVTGELGLRAALHKDSGVRVQLWTRTGCRVGHQKAPGCECDSGFAILLSALTVGIR